MDVFGKRFNRILNCWVKAWANNLIGKKYLKNLVVAAKRSKALCNISQLVYGMPQVPGLNPTWDYNINCSEYWNLLENKIITIVDRLSPIVKFSNDTVYTTCQMCLNS